MSSPNEKLYDFLAGQVAPYKGALPDMWAKFLAENGYSVAPIQKGINQYLGDQGYTGIFIKRWIEWYSAQIVGEGAPAGFSLWRTGTQTWRFGIQRAISPVRT